MNIDTNTPHVEKDWAEEFLLELRLRGVSGRRIGAALAEIEAHCAESGERAGEAFGDPVAYAEELAPQPTPTRDWGAELVPSGLGVAGMLLTLAALAALRTDTRVEVTTGALALVLLTVAGVALVTRFAGQVMRTMVRRWWVAVLGALAPIGLFVVVLQLGTRPLLTLGASGTLVAGVALLAGSTALSLRATVTGDPVIGPDEADGAGTVADDAVSRGLERLTPWLMPVLTVVMALPLLLIQR